MRHDVHVCARSIVSIPIYKKKKTKPEDEHLYQVQSPFEPHPDDEKPNKTLFPELQEMKNNTTNGNEDLINGKEQ